MYFLVITEAGARALEAMLGAERLEPCNRRRPVYTRRPRVLLQMFQREQRQGSRLILAQRDVGGLPPPFASAVRFSILIKKSQNTKQLRLLEARRPGIARVEGVYS